MYNNNNNNENNNSHSTYEYKYQTPTQPQPAKTVKAQPQMQTISNGKLLGFGSAIIVSSFVVSILGTIAGNTLTGANESTNQSPIDTPQIVASDTINSTPPTTESSNRSNNIFIESTNDTGSSNLTVQQIVEKTAPSVVEITTEHVKTANRMQQLVSTGAGSGVIISSSGYIITNHHVIDDADNVTITLSDGTQHQAIIIGSDDRTDIAVLKIEAEGLIPAAMGSSDDVYVGDDVVVVGNPLGQLGGTVTNGIISALDREITIDGTVMSLLQTNAAINQGNSGGGMFNSRGELIGIINAKSVATGVEGLGFAIPVDIAKTIAQDLIELGYIQGRVNLGITFWTVSDPLTAMMYNLKNLGIYIYNIEETSNAYNAGLRSGDLVTAVNGDPVEDVNQIIQVLDNETVGNMIEFTVLREGKTVDVSFVLQEKQHVVDTSTQINA